MASKSEPSTSVSGGFINIKSENIKTRYVKNYHRQRVNKFPVPRPMATFHGREDEIRELDEAFFTQQKNKVVIRSPGGFGKTEVSKHFAQQSLKEGKIKRVLWIPAETPNELKESYKILKPIYDSFADKQLLIIFDNYDNQQSIAEYEPRNLKHRVLITSRYKHWTSDVKIIELEPLSPESAIEVFKSVLGVKYNDEDEHLYEDLARLVGYVPLGLQITASFVFEQEDDDFYLAEYVSDLTNSQEIIFDEIIAESADSRYNKSLYAAVITSLNKIKNMQNQTPRIRELAHDLLCLNAYLHPDSMTKVDLLSLVNVKSKDKYTDCELKSALRLLSYFSFLRYHDNKRSYVVQHRTIQLFLRHYISKSNCQYYKMCLEWALEEHGFVNYSSNILNYADSNLTIVHDFYKDNYMHKDIGSFLEMLVRCECIECIKTIFKDPDEQTKTLMYQNNLLSECSSTNNLQILQILLSHVDINAKNVNQDTALHVLAQSEDLNGIKFLVSHGADVNVLNATGDPPLFTFIRVPDFVNDWDWDDVFTTFKSDFSLTNSNNQTLLHAAATGGKTKLIDNLIKNGLEVNKTDNNGWTPLDSLYKRILELDNPSAFSNNNAEILKTLLTVGATSNIKHKTTRTDDAFEFVLLNNALIRNDLDLLELLLNSGVDVNSRNRYQQTVLYNCKLNSKAAQILIKHNIDLYVRDITDSTPLFNFIHIYKLPRKDDDMDLIKDMLHLLQCHPDQIESSGNSALHEAAANHNFRLVELLLSHFSFDANTLNKAGDTPLHAGTSLLKYLPANHGKHKDIVGTIETLKKYHARLDLKNNLNETPVEMLVRLCTGNNEDIMNYVIPFLIGKEMI